MLNLNKYNKLNNEIHLSSFSAFTLVGSRRFARYFAKIMLASFFGFLLFLFLPWTQNIRSNGKLSTLYPEERPQTIQSTIAGRIEKWYVREGQYIHKGDTIAFISEIKDSYFDPRLIERTEEQIDAKRESIDAYEMKIQAIDAQIANNRNLQKLKIEQANNKIEQNLLKTQADSIEAQAESQNLEIAETRLERYEKLYNDGLISRTDYESRRIKFQESTAKYISTKNKLLSSVNEWINAKIELGNLKNEFEQKISKLISERSTARSMLMQSRADLVKLQNTLSNYEVRRGFYYITAPREGYVLKTLKAGIGETIKEGAPVASIMTKDYSAAVEIFVRPVDLPLFEIGDKVRIQFDGWPALVFSGWPNLSFGTFGGEVIAIDNFISENNLYRIMLIPDEEDPVEWPDQIRPGSGAKTWALLQDVPVWYEIWRQLNGFPPDYYESKTSDEKNGGGKEDKEK